MTDRTWHIFPDDSSHDLVDVCLRDSEYGADLLLGQFAGMAESMNLQDGGFGESRSPVLLSPMHAGVSPSATPITTGYAFRVQSRPVLIAARTLLGVETRRMIVAAPDLLGVGSHPMRITPCGVTLRIPISHVGRVGSKPEVPMSLVDDAADLIGADIVIPPAGTNVAGMQDALVAGWHVTGRGQPREAMRPNRRAIDGGLSVPVLVSESSPEPAITRDFGLRLKTLQRRHRSPECIGAWARAALKTIAGLTSEDDVAEMTGTLYGRLTKGAWCSVFTKHRSTLRRGVMRVLAVLDTQFEGGFVDGGDHLRLRQARSIIGVGHQDGQAQDVHHAACDTVLAVAFSREVDCLPTQGADRDLQDVAHATIRLHQDSPPGVMPRGVTSTAGVSWVYFTTPVCDNHAMSPVSYATSRMVA